MATTMMEMQGRDGVERRFESLLDQVARQRGRALDYSPEQIPAYKQGIQDFLYITVQTAADKLSPPEIRQAIGRVLEEWERYAVDAEWVEKRHEA